MSPAMTAPGLEQSRKEREKRAFELEMEVFFGRWAPEGPYERAQFEAQLFSLVRQIYRDAQEPLLEQLGKISSHVAMLPDVMRKE
jgi:hypothetical protein